MNLSEVNFREVFLALDVGNVSVLQANARFVYSACCPGDGYFVSSVAFHSSDLEQLPNFTGSIIL